MWDTCNKELEYLSKQLTEATSSKLNTELVENSDSEIFDFSITWEDSQKLKASLKRYHAIECCKNHQSLIIVKSETGDLREVRNQAHDFIAH